jgi:hypothetical protein
VTKKSILDIPNTLRGIFLPFCKRLKLPERNLEELAQKI